MQKQDEWWCGLLPSYSPKHDKPAGVVLSLGILWDKGREKPLFLNFYVRATFPDLSTDVIAEVFPPADAWSYGRKCR